MTPQAECQHYKHCDSCARKVQPNDYWTGARLTVTFKHNKEDIKLKLPKPLVEYLDEHKLTITTAKEIKLKTNGTKKKKKTEVPMSEAEGRTNKSETIIELFSDLEKAKYPLTSWETEFIDSISNQFDEKGTLSDRQFEILVRIHGQRT